MFNPSGIFGICTLHSKTLQYICLTDKEKLCADCAIIGKHRDSKNHNLKPLEYLNEDEYCELTPESIRLRKKILDKNEREKAAKKKKLAGI